VISRATLANLKAFGDEQSLNFACSNKSDVSKLTLLVGPNNSGKSSVLAAIDALLTADRPKVFTAAKEHRHGDCQPVLKVWHGDHNISIAASSGSKFSIEGDIEPIRKLIKFVPSRRPWVESFSNSMVEDAYRNSYRANRQSNRYWVDSNFGAALMTLSLRA
jgi:hypothetical protein